MIVSVVVCTYNRAKLLIKNLNSLANQSIEKTFFEVIVVDNNSTDKTTEVTQEYCKKYNNFRYILETKLGLSNARNRGWEEAKGEYIAYIDDDAKAEICWVENIIKRINEFKPDIIGGKILPWYLDNPPKWYKDELEIRAFGDDGWLDVKKYPFGFSGANMIIKKTVLKELNGFSSNFGMVGNKLVMGEESEFFYRAINKGFLLYYNSAIVVYHAVTNKNYTILNFIKRAYSSGIGIALIRNEDLFSIKGIRKILLLFARLFLFLIFSFYYFFRRDYFIVLLSRLFFALGYVAGLTKNQTRN